MTKELRLTLAKIPSDPQITLPLVEYTSSDGEYTLEELHTFGQDFARWMSGNLSCAFWDGMVQEIIRRSADEDLERAGAQKLKVNH